VLASAKGDETAGNQDYQHGHMSKIFSEGFSFSGFERDKLYLNQKGNYVDISGISGLDEVGDGRGAAWADFDNDGDYDLFLTQLQGDVHRLYRNEVGQRNNSLKIELVGQESGNDAWGTEVRIKTSQGILTNIKAGGSGFVSQSDPRLIFGLGSDVSAEWLEVRWPSGLRQHFGRVHSGVLRIIEGQNPVQLRLEEQLSTTLPDPVKKTTTQKAQLWDLLNLKQDSPFPNIAMKKIGGISTEFSTFRNNDHYYLINFWATYCAPCRREMPELDSLFTSLAEDGIQVIGVSLDMGTSKDRIPAFLQKLKITYPIFTTDQHTFEKIYNSEQIFIPLSVLVDQQGRVVEALSGWSEQSSEIIRSWKH